MENDVTKPSFEIVSYGEKQRSWKRNCCIKNQLMETRTSQVLISLLKFNIIKEKVKGVLKVYDSKGFDASSTIFEL